MSFLLDTCYLSEFVKDRPDPKVVAWSQNQPENLLHMSVLTLGEIRQGIIRLVPSKRKTALEKWLDQELMPRFAGRILPVTDAVALTWGKIQGETRLRGKPLAVIDGLIAATALTHDLTLITRNVADMRESGAAIFNPWE